MQTTLTQDDWKNIIVLISKAQISGAEATPVAILLQKINNILNTPEKPKDEKVPAK